MEFQQSIEELRENVEELQRQYKLKRLRRILKFILIGFLIGRDSEKRIVELEQRNNLIIQRITSHIDELDIQANLRERIREFVDTYGYLKSLGEKVKSFEETFPHAKSLVLKVKESLEKQLGILIENLKSTVEQRLSELKKQVEEVETKGTYLIYTEKQRYVESIDSIEKDLDYCIKQQILDSDFLSKKKDMMKQYLKRVLGYNKRFIAHRKKEYSNLWQIEPLALDDEQQTAIVTDDKHNLVIAAAGSGKTEVLTTRIAYLITRKPDTIRPQRILGIAYQRKAMEQIKQRLYQRHKIHNVNIKTFHKLGKDILEETGEYFGTADIVNNNGKHRIINRIFKQKIKNEPTFYQKFLDFVRTLHDKEVEVKVEEKNRNLEYARKRPYFSINNIQVNSRAEKELMDFFLIHKLNGRTIAVRYEPNIGGFRPDFHLPEYDLFIEHWGLTKEGKVPEWFSQTTEEYKQAMEMKKQWFTQHKKVLIETFAYEYNEKNPDPFLDLIKTRVSSTLQAKYDRNFKFTLKSYEEILDVAWQSYRTPEDDISSFITIAKTYGLSPERIKRKLQKDNWSPKQIAFGNLALPMFSAYEEALRELRKIDFEDMINKAITKLEGNSNLRTDLYDHILIDEYQDISAQRYRLIKKLMDRNPSCKLFGVGDDWQSIMGFSGSNLNFLVNFDQYFENPAITKISTNYRSIKTIVDAGASLIKNNTRCQIQKPSQSKDTRTRPIRVLKTLATGFERNYDFQAAVDCIDRIQQYLQDGCSPKDILVLSRCMRTRTKPHGYKFLSYIKTLIDIAEENDMQLAHDMVYKENKVRLLTAHRSKGLEAKVVFLLNVTEDTYGFPCQIEDSTIYEPARENYPPQNHLEEERRLFYVAITRAMEDLYIYTRELAPSAFLEEIIDFTTEEPLRTFEQGTVTEPLTHVESSKQVKEHEKSYSVERIRQNYPDAYKKWTSEEEKALEKQFKAGNTIAKIAELHERKPGAIRSRLRKIGLLESEKSYIV